MAPCDCMIVIQPNSSAYRAVCVDVATRLTIGCPSVSRAPDGTAPAILAADVISMIGGIARLRPRSISGRINWLGKPVGCLSNCAGAGACGGGGRVEGHS